MTFVVFAIIAYCVFGFWGTATSSYQIEGAYNAARKQPSIWDNFTHIPGKIWKDQNGDIADDFYHRYKEDVAFMAGLELDFFRFSISWPRVMLPSGEPNLAGIQFYSDVINELLARGKQPFVTLFHWDLPQIYQDRYGGFLSEDIVFDFNRFAQLCFDSFPQVKHWITFNEPWTICINGYLSGDHAPGRCSDRSKCPEGNSSTEPYICAHNLLLAHAQAVHTFRSGNYAGTIGMTINIEWPQAISSNAADSQAAQRAIEFEFGWFADPLYKGDYPTVMREMIGERLPRFNETSSKKLKGSYDFFGVNHYSSRYVQNCPTCPDLQNWFTDMKVKVTFTDLDGNLIGPPAASDWLHYVPWGIRKVLSWVSDRYDQPIIYVTENGCDDVGSEPDALHDTYRQVFLQNYVYNVYLAWKDGVDVRGYFVWSLMDNFEWSDGFQYRFGLVYVDYNKNMTRTPKDSYYVFKKIMANYTFQNSLQEIHSSIH